MDGEACSAATNTSKKPFLGIFGIYLTAVLVVSFLVTLRRKVGKTFENQDGSLQVEDEQDLIKAAHRRKEARDELAQHLEHLKKFQNEVRSQIVHLRAAFLKIKK